MATIQIKHVPETTHAELRRRAEAQGKSLQEYMLALLNDETRLPTVDEWLDEAEAGPLTDLDVNTITEFLRADRDSH